MLAGGGGPGEGGWKDVGRLVTVTTDDPNIPQDVCVRTHRKVSLRGKTRVSLTDESQASDLKFIDDVSINKLKKLIFYFYTHIPLQMLFLIDNKGESEILRTVKLWANTKPVILAIYIEL